jgi:hypothetical protein
MLLATNTSWIEQIKLLAGTIIVVFSAVAFVLALFIGLIIDAIRNLLEGVWDRFSATDPEGEWWDFFFEGDESKLEKLTDHYYSYYVFDMNATISIGLSILLNVIGAIFFWKETMWILIGVTIFGALLGILLLLDARNLRNDIRRLALNGMSTRAEGQNGEEDAT